MMVLVTGGAASGKSAFAETLACAFAGAGGYGKGTGEANNGKADGGDGCCGGVGGSGSPAFPSASGFPSITNAPRFSENPLGNLIYLATMRPFGMEGAARVARHRAQRAGKGFATLECYGSLHDALATGRLDGATVLLEDLGNLVANGLFDTVDWDADRALRDIGDAGRRTTNLVIVGNEVGCDGVPYDGETSRYQEELGRLACRTAALAEAVFECVCGVPCALKALDSGAMGERNCVGGPSLPPVFAAVDSFPISPVSAHEAQSELP